MEIKKVSRPINTIIIHCAATPPSMNIGVKEIDRWHRLRGFFGIGYHYVIRRDGNIETGRDLNKIGAHAENHNTGSIGICLVGGVDKENKPECNFTKEQWESLKELVESLKKSIPTITHIIGHNEVANKACPSFNVQKWIKNGMKGLNNYEA